MLNLGAIRIIPYRKESAAFNMAADLYLLEHSLLPSLRFYGWSKPALSFGKSNHTLTDLDLEFCQNQDFDFVIRPSGGKTVFHDQELTYCLTCPPQLFPNSILETYRIISQSFIQALTKLSVFTSMQPTKHKSSQSSNCFQEISAWEITQVGKKLIGSAQLRKNNRLLQHGSILLAVDYIKWHKIWPKISPAKLKSRIIGLSALKSTIYSPQQLSEFLTPHLCSSWQAQPSIKPFTASERVKINKLALSRPTLSLRAKSS